MDLVYEEAGALTAMRDIGIKLHLQKRVSRYKDV